MVITNRAIAWLLAGVLVLAAVITAPQWVDEARDAAHWAFMALLPVTNPQG